MKFTLSDDPKVNATGARSCPQGFGRFIDVEPGDEFDVYDVELVSNPTFRDLDLFVPADGEARSALDAARTASDPVPVEGQGNEPVEPVEEGEDPVIAAILQEAADRAEAKAEPTPDVAQVQDPFAVPATVPAGDVPADPPAAPGTATQPPAFAVEDPKTARAPRVRTPQED